MQLRLPLVTFWRAGFAIVTVHLLMLAATQWLIYDHFRGRTPADLHGSVATVFQRESASIYAAELIALVTGVLLVRRRSGPSTTSTDRTVGALLVSYAPIAIASIGIAVAILAGWDLDVWVLSSSTATPAQTAATLREALPFVLAPLSTVRHIANFSAMVLLAIVLHRTCAVPVRRSFAVAAAWAAVMTLAHAAL